MKTKKKKNNNEIIEQKNMKKNFKLRFETELLIKKRK